MGIAAISPGPNLSKRHAKHQIYPYLLRGVSAAYPNPVWGNAITYVRLRTSWMYLVAVLDWFARYVVSWALSDSLELPFVLEAVEAALALDTIFSERFWRSLKYEEIYLYDYESPRAARHGIAAI